MGVRLARDDVADGTADIEKLTLWNGVCARCWFASVEDGLHRVEGRPAELRAHAQAVAHLEAEPDTSPGPHAMTRPGYFRPDGTMEPEQTCDGYNGGEAR